MILVELVEIYFVGDSVSGFIDIEQGFQKLTRLII